MSSRQTRPFSGYPSRISAPTVVARVGLAILVPVALLSAARPLQACPGCEATQPTLVEELQSLDIAVLAVQVGQKQPPANPGKLTLDLDEQATFRITKVLKGAEHLGSAREVSVLYFGREPAGTVFYLTASRGEPLRWNTPMALTLRGVHYLETVVNLPQDRAARLAVLQPYLEDKDPLIAIDAYNEFAIAPYEALKQLRPKMNRQQLRAWVRDERISPNHRKLYLTMLGICGTEADASLLQSLLIDTNGNTGALDSLVAGYLVLRGSEGLPLVEKTFLVSPNATYVDTFAAVQGLRITEQLTDRISRQRLAQSLRLVLERGDVADLVIPDLARWQDWQSLDRLVRLFHEAPPASRSAVRTSVLRYLLACPLPAAKVQRQKLAALDPAAMKRATALFPLGAAPRSAPPASE